MKYLPLDVKQQLINEPLTNQPEVKTKRPSHFSAETERGKWLIFYKHFFYLFTYTIVKNDYHMRWCSCRLIVPRLMTLVIKESTTGKEETKHYTELEIKQHEPHLKPVKNSVTDPLVSWVVVLLNDMNIISYGNQIDDIFVLVSSRDYWGISYSNRWSGIFFIIILL
jgi:hypothetical protein